MYGFDSGTDLVLEVINGNGIGEGLFDGNFDNNKYKNSFGRISQDAGEHLRFLGFGYWEKEQQQNTLGNISNNKMWMIGVMPHFLLIPLN